MNSAQILLIILAHDFQYYFHHFGYIGIYTFFITVDQIAPIPEEITLIVIGYFASQGVLNPFLAGLFSLAAFLTIDIIYFYLTKNGSKFIKKLTKKSADSGTASRYENQLKKNLPKTLLVLSFIPRVRLLSPIFVALAGLPFKRFIIYNSLGLALFSTIYISLGIIFHASLGTLMAKMGAYQHIIFIGFVIIMVGLSIWIAKKFNRQKTKS
jgi:membrane protein DedA with SNARE-associated domain